MSLFILRKILYLIHKSRCEMNMRQKTRFPSTKAFLYHFFTFRKGIGGNGRFFFVLKNGIMNYCKVRDGEEPPFFRAYILQ